MKLLFFQSKVYKNNTAPTVEGLVQSLVGCQKKVHARGLEELLDFCGACGFELAKLQKKYPYLRNFCEFLDKNTLRKNLQIALHGDVGSLDGFVSLGDPVKLYHAQPRGLVVQWLAGNVVVLGLFSIFNALLTKNVTLVKASQKGADELVELLQIISRIKTARLSGRDFLSGLAVISASRTETEVHRQLSQAADVRLAWGGTEAIQTISQLPRKLYAEDILLGPKYSYAVIDKVALREDKTLAARLAIDVSVFDQYACSSPHTVFIEGNRAAVKKFAQLLATELARVNRLLLPKGSTAAGKAMEILALRAKYLLTGKVYQSLGTEWTVIVTTEPGLADGCFERVIFVKSIRSLFELNSLNSRKTQTLGAAIGSSDRLDLLDKITLSGIDRVPRLGFMTYFESPWDGMFIFDRLVRWVTANK